MEILIPAGVVIISASWHLPVDPVVKSSDLLQRRQLHLHEASQMHEAELGGRIPSISQTGKSHGFGDSHVALQVIRRR